MTASPGFAEFLHEHFRRLGHITLRRMFGSTGVFCQGVMLAIVTDDTLYFRIDDGNRTTLAEALENPPLTYQKQGKTLPLPFWPAPDRLLDEPDELLAWSRHALAAAHRVAARRPPKRRK